LGDKNFSHDTNLRVSGRAYCYPNLWSKANGRSVRCHLE